MAIFHTYLCVYFVPIQTPFPLVKFFKGHRILTAELKPRRKINSHITLFLENFSKYFFFFFKKLSTKNQQQEVFFSFKKNMRDEGNSGQPYYFATCNTNYNCFGILRPTVKCLCLCNGFYFFSVAL